MGISFTQIGSTSDCFFWTLKEHDGKLYVGTYGYPKIYNYPPWTLQKNLDAGESVCDLKILNTKLYACTENKGYIYRMDSPSVWPRVHDDAYPWALGFGIMGSYIYCALADSPWTGEAKIIRSSNGTSWSQVKIWSGGWFFILYNGYLYNLGGSENGGITSCAIRTSNGTTWPAIPELAGFDGAWNPALVHNGYLYMALGERSDGKTRIYKYNGSTAPSQVLEVTAYRAYGFNNVAVHDGEMYFLFGPDMNSASPGAVTYFLYKSATGNSGDWTLVKTFYANRKLSHGKYRTQGCVGTYDGDLYVGIQDKLYKMVETEAFETENLYGMVVLNPKPSSSELDQLKREGLNFIWVMGFSEAFVNLCETKDIDCIIGISHTDYGNNKPNVLAYMIKDEPFGLGYTLEQIIQMAIDAKALTDKPVGYNITGYRTKDAFPTLNAYVDYTITGAYPYRDDKFYGCELDEYWEEAVNRITVPMIAIAQAHEASNCTYPQIPPQKDFWYPKPMGLIWYEWYGGGGLIKTDETIRKGMRLTPDIPPWDNRPDLEDGTLVNVLVPMGITKLELKRTQLSGSYQFTFDAGKRVKWQSFENTIHNRNVFFRDDFLDNLLEDWVVVGGTWAVSHYFLEGSGSVTWQNNRIRIGPTTWQGQDILLKSYLSSGAQQHRFFLRADHQGYNVNSYIIGVSRTGVTVGFYRVANGSVLEEVYKACPVLGSGWKWFRIQIYTSGGNVTARVKWWLPENDEPGWIASHTWTGIWRSSGCFSIGRHIADGGEENHYTNAVISRYEGTPSPPNSSVSFQFWPSYDGANLGPEYSSITQLPPARYAIIKANFSRNDLLSAMPTIENMNVDCETKHQPILI